MAFDLMLEFILPAKPERVMELLTDPVLIRKWSGGAAVLEREVGGKFEMFDGWVSGELVKLSGNELIYTWKTTDWPTEAASSEVCYFLTKDGEGTKVTLRQSGFPSEDEMRDHQNGWTDYFFDPLEDFIMIFDNSR